MSAATDVDGLVFHTMALYATCIDKTISYERK